MGTKGYFLVVCVSLSLFIQSDCRRSADPFRKPLPGTEDFLLDSYSFTLKVLRELMTTHSDENIIFSPFAIRNTLASMYAGASGTTAQEIARLLNVTGSPDDVVASYAEFLRRIPGKRRVKFANKLYLDETVTVNEDYENLLKTSFKTPVESVDFKGERYADDISDWVSARTQRLIDGIVDPGSLDNAQAAFVSALGFDASLFEVDYRRVEKGTFWLDENTSKDVDMMISETRSAPSILHPNVTIVFIPFYHKHYILMLAMPTELNGADLCFEKLVHSIDKRSLFFFQPPIVHGTSATDVPKFSVNFTLSMKETLRGLGLTETFSDNPDFSKISSTPGFSIADIPHKATIEINPLGASVANVQMGGRFSGPKRIDKPFFFFVQDEFRNVYLAGRVVDPSL